MSDLAAIVQSTEAEAVLFCPSCLYDLRGITADSCPECGAAIDREKLAKSSIPWIHRRGLGLGAMLKTAWLATFRTNLFCLEVARPVSLKDARQFRRLIVALLMLATAMTAVVMLSSIEDLREPLEFFIRQQLLLLITAGLFAGGLLWLFLMAVTGIHMYWFHPKGLTVQQQNRAVALSHYACAPLIALVPAIIFFTIGNAIGIASEDSGSDTLFWIAIPFVLFGFVLALMSIVSFLFVTVRMARYTAQRSGLARLTLWLGLPPLWLLLGVLVFGILPLGGAYLYLAIVGF